MKIHLAQVDVPFLGFIAAPRCGQSMPGDELADVLAEVTCESCKRLAAMEADARRPRHPMRKKFR
jgi:hypothetical protein